MKILVTGCAGFIGFHITKKLLKKKSNKIYGIDNLNKFYDVNLKKNRLYILNEFKNFTFDKIDIRNTKLVSKNFLKNKYDIVIHLAAQAGVRYSYEKPELYINTNINGFNNIIENSRIIKVKHFIFASTSSVYGNLKKYPYKETFKNLSPESLYAATKLTNENIAYSFSKIFK